MFRSHCWLLIALTSSACASSNDLPGGGAAAGSAMTAMGGSAASGGSQAAGGSLTTGGSSDGPSASGGSVAGGSSTSPEAGSLSGGGAGASGATAGGANTGGAAMASAGNAGSAGSATPVTDPGSEGDGDVTVGPNYTTQADLRAGNAPAGKTFSFSMSSSDSKIFTGLDATLTSPKPFSRLVTVYVPAKYKDGTAAPFMTIQDGARAHYDLVRLAVENLSQSTDPARRLPAIIVVAIHNGPGDSKGSERGLEYDTMSNRYGRFVDEEVLPAVLANAQIKAAYPNLKFTDDPEGRGTVGCSSGAAAAVIQAWMQPDKFRKVIAYSATLVAQQDDDAPENALYPHGAWDLHSDLALIANSERKPIRIVIGANQMDNGAGTGEANRHDWLLANQRTAAALKAKGYHYRFIYGLGAAHCTQGVENATMADNMLWLWRGYPTQ